MRACSHTEAIAPRAVAMSASVASTAFAVPRTAFVYQQHPTKPNGGPILPHVFPDGKGKNVNVLGGKWDSVDPNQAALDLGEWAARTIGNAAGPVVLNIESIPLDTPEARAFWTPALTALRTACPRAAFGFYDSPALADLVDFYAPSVYPFKRINAECWADGEHEQTPARYRQITYSNLARFPRARRWLACATVTVDMGTHAEWASTLELREQWRVAQDMGADLIWWGSVATETDLRRACKAIEWVATQRRVSTVVA